MIHSFLLIGQSNMAGRGFVDEVEPIANGSIKVLRNGRWLNMYTPVNPDRAFAGVNLAESFADLYQKDHNVEVGLIPCADGGTSIDQWCVGGVLFDHACYMAELASRTSTIAGVLWHQGESDCADNRHPYYEEKLITVMEAFRKKLGLSDVPFLFGGLGEYLANCECAPECKNYEYINKQLKSAAQKLPMTGFVSAEGLGSNPDNLHFSAKALREFGARYYEEFLKLEDKNKVFCEKENTLEALKTAMEAL